MILVTNVVDVLASCQYHSAGKFISSTQMGHKVVPIGHSFKGEDDPLPGKTRFT
jgi:hypothetical protein